MAGRGGYMTLQARVTALEKRLVAQADEAEPGPVDLDELARAIAQAEPSTYAGRALVLFWEMLPTKGVGLGHEFGQEETATRS